MESRDGHPSHDEYALLTDIMGLEDHYGDMDFKVTGSEEGVTAVQLDVKLAGSWRILLEPRLLLDRLPC